jgi:hypothetical protein
MTSNGQRKEGKDAGAESNLTAKRSKTGKPYMHEIDGGDVAPTLKITGGAGHSAGDHEHMGMEDRG